MENTDVFWLLLCLDLEDEELSNELLVEIWLMIHRFSMVNAWMDYYKQSAESGQKHKNYN